MKIPLSVVILARNEAKNIDRCVRSLRGCDEVVVVDDGSTDGTAEVAVRAGARVVQHSFEGFASQRNWAMDCAGLKHEWVLHLDADEVMTVELESELRRTLESTDEETAAFRMCRKTIFQGRWLRYSDGFPVWIMRLVRRGRAAFVDQGHGEVPLPPVHGHMGVIRSPFLHYAFSKGIADWISRHNRYSTREAGLEFSETAPSTHFRDIFGHPGMRRQFLRKVSRRLPCRAVLRFFYQYVCKLGFLDGRPGFTFCVLMATYEYWIVLKRNELELEFLDKREASDSH